jgi:hypothetical protein
MQLVPVAKVDLALRNPRALWGENSSKFGLNDENIQK